MKKKKKYDLFCTLITVGTFIHAFYVVFYDDLFWWELKTILTSKCFQSLSLLPFRKENLVFACLSSLSFSPSVYQSQNSSYTCKCQSRIRNGWGKSPDDRRRGEMKERSQIKRGREGRGWKVNWVERGWEAAWQVNQPEDQVVSKKPVEDRKVKTSMLPSWNK